MAKEKATKSTSIWRRLWPALTFMGGLLLLVAFFYGEEIKKPNPTMTTNIPSTAKARYTVAKKVFEQFKQKDNITQKQWHSLAQEFFAIYEEYPTWPNRPAALFRNAMVLELMAEENSDYDLAIERYIKLATEFKNSLLADDALLQAAIIQGIKLDHFDKSLQLLEYIRTNLPKGDMYKKALALEKKLAANTNQAVSKKRLELDQALEQENSNAALTQVSWVTLNENTVEITVALDQSITWRVAKGKGQQILLIMDDTSPVKGIKQGARIKNSMLTQLAIIKQKRGSTDLMLDFAQLYNYQTKVLQNPFRIILTATAKTAPKLDKNTPTSAPLVAQIEKHKVKKSEISTQNAQSKVVAPQKKAAAKSVEKVKAAPKKAVNKQVAVKSNAKTEVKRAVSQKPPKKDEAKVEPDAKPNLVAKANVVPTKRELSKRVQKSNTKNMALQLGLSVQSVFIDIGHGGRDPGAIGNGIVERDIVLDVGLRLGKILKSYGLNVVYSRTKDVSVPLSARPVQANAAQSDLFISIHVNANKDTRVHGFETYYLNFAKNAHAAQTAALENATSDRKLGDIQNLLANVMLNVRTSESSGLAEDVLNATLQNLKKNGFNTKNAGTRSAPFHVLIDTHMPAILVEVGYCSNKSEAARLKQSKYRDILAMGIAHGVMKYKNRLEKGRDSHFALTNNDDDAM